MMGTMSMYYVTNPDGVVANIQTLLDTGKQESKQMQRNITPDQTKSIPKSTQNKHTPRHTLDTREKVRAITNK
jgi:hypothetical protein